MLHAITFCQFRRHKWRNELYETKEVTAPFLHPESIMKIITIIKFFVMYGLQIKNKIVSLHLKN